MYLKLYQKLQRHPAAIHFPVNSPDLQPAFFRVLNQSFHLFPRGVYKITDMPSFIKAARNKPSRKSGYSTVADNLHQCWFRIVIHKPTEKIVWQSGCIRTHIIICAKCFNCLFTASVPSADCTMHSPQLIRHFFTAGSKRQSEFATYFSNYRTANPRKFVDSIRCTVHYAYTLQIWQNFHFVKITRRDAEPRTYRATRKRFLTNTSAILTQCPYYCCASRNIYYISGNFHDIRNIRAWHNIIICVQTLNNPRISILPQILLPQYHAPFDVLDERHPQPRLHVIERLFFSVKTHGWL